MADNMYVDAYSHGLAIATYTCHCRGWPAHGACCTDESWCVLDGRDHGQQMRSTEQPLQNPPDHPVMKPRHSVSPLLHSLCWGQLYCQTKSCPCIPGFRIMICRCPSLTATHYLIWVAIYIDVQWHHVSLPLLLLAGPKGHTYTRLCIIFTENGRWPGAILYSGV